MQEEYMSEIKVTTQRLQKAIDIIMNELSSLEARQEANSYIERLKSEENALMLMQISTSFLRVTDSSPFHKHFAFQLLEHVIKYSWNSIDVTLKQEIKVFIEGWVNDDNVCNFLQSSRHLMHAASRCCIEVMMREWPQSWPNILSLLLSKRRSHLSLFIIWQLAEDIGVFYLPSNPQRRREMNCEFSNHLKSIYAYINDCIVCYDDYELCHRSLSTLHGLLEWTPFDANLLQVLCQMLVADLNNSKNCLQLKQVVCDCILLCLNRKPLKANDKEVIHVLFSHHNFESIIRITRFVFKYITIKY